VVPSACGNPCDATWPEDALTGGVLRPRLFLSRFAAPAFRPYAGCIATYYDTLGVEPSASPDQIRAAYRERARLHHPDRDRSAATDTMATVNEAYRVLGDPRRRFEYDRSLHLHGSAVGPAHAVPGRDRNHDVDVARSVPRVAPSRLMPAGPARIPWRMMAVMAVVGSAVILFAASFNDPPSTETPDGILRVGSCVEVEENFDVREVSCTGEDDLIVDLVLPTDATCPAGLGRFRDRLGLGTVCIEID
jgi:hypothetical protein